MNTKALRQKILDLAIHGKLVPQDPNDEPVSVLLERIKAEKERLIKEGKIKRTKRSKAACDKPHYPYELPEGWCWTTIEDVCSKIGSGSTPKGSNYSKEGIPFFRSQNVQNFGIVLSDIKYISEEVHQSMKGTEVIANDLLLNITGGSLGRCAVVPINFKIGNVSQHVCILRTVLVKPEYLHCFILSSFFAKSMKITGSGREGLPKYNLEKMLFPLPPIHEQERIIIEVKQLLNYIDKLDTCRGNLIELVSHAKSKVLDLAIHGKLVPQNSSDEPASELLKRINPKAEITCDNPQYGNLPKGWCICRLKDMAKVITGSTPSKSNKEYYGGNFPFYKPADLDLGRHVNKASEYLTQAGKNVSRLVPSGTTAVCCIGSIGKVGFLEYEGTTNQQINCVIPSECLDNVYLYYSCSSQWFYSSLIAESSAVTISIVNKSKMENVVMPLPPLQEQHRIVAKIEELFTQLDKIEASL